MPSQICYKFAFFAYAYNLAEVTRAIEIATALRERGAEIEFFTHGGYHENHITEAGFVLNKLNPVVSPEKHEFLIGIEQGRTFRPPFTTNELSEHVKSEVSALRVFVPDAVYSGMNVPCCISARAIGVPLISVLPTPVTAVYFHHRLASFPESHANVISNILPQKWKNRFFNWLMPRARIGIGRFNRVARQHGVPPFRAFIGGVFSGDLTLLADIPEITGIPESAFPPNYHYIGPLFAHLPLSLPEEVCHVFSMPGINVYCAMGSSAQPAILRKAIEAVIASGHNAVIATTSILDPSELGALPENVYATRYLPAHQVNELADVSLIHGGQGTVQTACWAGTPIIGLALQFEQQANLDMIVQAGMGVRIPMCDYTKKKILFEVNRVAQDSTFRQKAQKIKEIMRNMDGAQNAAERILTYLGDQSQLTALNKRKAHE